MPKLKELLTALGKKAGIDLTKPEFKDILASEVEVPEEFSTALEKNLMDFNAAVNNAKIKAQIKAEVYNGIDSDFESSLDDFELADDVKTTILGEKKTVERVKKLAAHLKEEAGKAAKAGNKPEAEALKKQVEELNNQIKTINANSTKAIDQLKADNENTLINYSLKSILNGKQYVLPEQMSPDEKVDMVHSIVGMNMTEQGLKLVRENGKLKLMKADGTIPYDDKNNPVELSSFVDNTLSKRGLLKVSDPGAQGGQGNGGAPAPVPGNAGGAPVIPPTFQTALGQIDQLIAEQAASAN